MTTTAVGTYQSRKAILQDCLKAKHQVIFNVKVMTRDNPPFQTILCPTCSEKMRRLGFPKGLRTVARFFRYMKRDIWVQQEGSSYINIHTPWDTVIEFVMWVGFAIPAVMIGIAFFEIFYYGY